MKKLLSFTFIAIFTAAQLFAQESVFNKGDKVFNAGIGFGSSLYSGTGNKSLIPPLSASVEVGIVDNILEKGVIGVGGYMGFSQYKWEYSNWGWKYTNLVLGARGNFHYPLVDKLDTYTGLMLGYNIRSSKEIGTATGNLYEASASGLVSAWFVGARYYFQENLAAMAELGYGVAYLNLGIALKF